MELLINWVVLSICLFLTYIVIKGFITIMLMNDSHFNRKDYENLQVVFVIVMCIFWGLFYYLTHLNV